MGGERGGMPFVNVKIHHERVNLVGHLYPYLFVFIVAVRHRRPLTTVRSHCRPPTAHHRALSSSVVCSPLCAVAICHCRARCVPTLAALDLDVSSLGDLLALTWQCIPASFAIFTSFFVVSLINSLYMP